MANISDFSNRADELPEQEFPPIKEDWYQVEVKKAELKGTKGGGEGIAVQVSVLGPTHAGRVAFDFINVRNSNPEAETIGLRTLKGYRMACGIAVLRDTDELVGRTLEAFLKNENSEEFGQKLKVSKVRAAGGASAMPKPAGAPAAAGGSAPPWAKK